MVCTYDRAGIGGSNPAEGPRSAASGAGLPGRLRAKLEMRNPGGSVKDGLATALLDDAERSGRLRPTFIATTFVAPGGDRRRGASPRRALVPYLNP